MLRFVLFLIAAAIAVPATAQNRQPSHCIALAQTAPGVEYLSPASFRDPAPQHSVRLRYLTHAAFLIQSPGGVAAVTDYNGFTGSAVFQPDIVTMNHAHGTHWTPNPDPAIPHVLKGWGPFGQGIAHHLSVGDMLVRNVSTDIRSTLTGVEPLGNSIFVFEVAGLCIGHLGHLHHALTDDQYAALGRLDVVMAPVDGGYTLDPATMISVLRRIEARIVIPMHWFGETGLARFVAGMEDTFDVIDTGDATLTVSLRSLPDSPTVVVLRPAYLRQDE